MKDSMFNNPIKAVGLAKYQERRCFVAVKNSFVKYIQGSSNKLCVITTPREILRLYFLFLNDVHASMNFLLRSLSTGIDGPLTAMLLLYISTRSRLSSLVISQGRPTRSLCVNLLNQLTLILFISTK